MPFLRMVARAFKRLSQHLVSLALLKRPCSSVSKKRVLKPASHATLITRNPLRCVCFPNAPTFVCTIIGELFKKLVYVTKKSSGSH